MSEHAHAPQEGESSAGERHEHEPLLPELPKWTEGPHDIQRTAENIYTLGKEVPEMPEYMKHLREAREAKEAASSASNASQAAETASTVTFPRLSGQVGYALELATRVLSS
jgi:hypothetical protein